MQEVGGHVGRPLAFELLELVSIISWVTEYGSGCTYTGLKARAGAGAAEQRQPAKDRQPVESGDG